MLKLLNIVHDVAVSSGGLGLAALGYAKALSSAGANVTVLSSSSDNTSVFRATFHSARFDLVDAPYPAHKLIKQYTILDQLCKENPFDVVHLHGFWRPLFCVAAFILRRRGIPFVLSPHGCLEPWAIQHKRVKKWVASKTYQGLINTAAAMFFATSNQELESIRGAGISKPIAMLPNGVDIDISDSPKRKRYQATRSILFLSRIHPIKGLPMLVEAWAYVRKPGWKIVIAGPDVAGHKCEVEAQIKARRLQSDFEFVGLVSGQQKQECLADADIFILPSYSENFGISVIEALLSQLPVITTTGAPWRELEDYKCGWWVNPSAADIATALKSAMDTRPEELERMGQRGRQLVADKYSWHQIGKEGLKAYEWILGRDSCRPEFVDIARV